MDNNRMYHMVKKFHEAFGHEVATEPTAIEEKTAVNRAVWTGEELVEFLYATAEGDESKFQALYDQFLTGLNKAADKILTQKNQLKIN